KAYNIFRWYRGGWGRYTQSDPIGVGGPGLFDGGAFIRWPHIYSLRASGGSEFTAIAARELNAYAYVADNPLLFIDHDGLETLTCAVAALWSKPVNVHGVPHCTYGGLCVGKETRRKFIS